MRKTNDLYGHMAGDDLIINVSHEICQTFKHSPVFRVGEMSLWQYWKRRISMNMKVWWSSSGKSWSKRDWTTILNWSCLLPAVYDADMDTSVTDVFQRADYIMYQNKLSMKQTTNG